MSRFVDRSEASIYKISFRRQTIELTFTTHRAIFSRISMKLTRRKNCFRMKRIFFFFFESFSLSLLHEFSQKENFSNSRFATNILRDKVNHDERLNENLNRCNIKSRINLRLINHEKAIDKFTTNVRRDKQHLKSHNDYKSIDQH
jgi:hypothetical protein